MSIMQIIGRCVFTVLCSKTKNDPDNYLKLILMDRADPNCNHFGLDCMEWNKIGITDEAILNNMSSATLREYGIE